jgi:hypothetical protein
VLTKAMVKSWVARGKSHGSPPAEVPVDLTSTLSLAKSQLGTLSGAEMLADHLFQLLPQLLVLNLTRAAMDSRAFEALASGLLAKNMKNATDAADGTTSPHSLFAAHLTSLIVDSNYVTRGRPRPRQKGFSNTQGNPDDNFFEITLAGLERLGEAVRKHPRLHTLSIRKNSLGLDGSRRFLRILLKDKTPPHATTSLQNSAPLYASMRTLTSLDMSSNGTKNKGMAAARDLTLGPGAVLKSLNMTHNLIDQAGFHAFFEPPQQNIDAPRTLEILVLRQNYFTLQSVQTLVAALRSPAWARLSKLDVSFCKMGDIGASLLANLIKTNPSITSLHLKGCELTDNGKKFRGALELIGVLRDANRYVRELDLSSNCLVYRRLGRFNDEDQCGWELANMIRQNKALARVDLRGNAFGMKVRIALKKALRENPRASLVDDCKVAFWMCKQRRLGARSPARVLWYGMVKYICEFLGEKRDGGEVLF